MTDAVRAHYQAGIPDQATLLAKVRRALDEIEPPLTAEKLASFDQFHVGAIAATIELAKRAGLTRDMQILDAGSGLGGPSRYLAETIGCHVTGVDLAPAYVAVATLLADRAGLADNVSYQVGSITELPFADGSFDAVWSQHVVMNIPDRARLYRELRRVLKPGGRFVFYDPYAPENGAPPYFPVPWADTPATSTLLTKDATIAALKDAGFEVLAFDDVTGMALPWFAEQQQGMRLGMVMGERMREMVSNLNRSIGEGRVRLVMGRASR